MLTRYISKYAECYDGDYIVQLMFIRRAYYGGHTDTYKPYGENLYYYDVNSLYPFVMKEFPMPGGVPVWHANLEGKDLDSIFGWSICGMSEDYQEALSTLSGQE